MRNLFLPGEITERVNCCDRIEPLCKHPANPVMVADQSWEYARLGLAVKAHRVLNRRLEGDVEHPKTPLLPYNPMQLGAEEETVTLVPFGFTHLRVAYLPLASRV
jgi:hypothetical protein